MALNRNKVIKNAHSLSDKTAAWVTDIAGSMPFMLLNIGAFTLWILMNTGAFGERFIIDAFPFNFLTTAVSLEAIVLSIFVLMGQRRQSKVTELRTELDYHADLQAEVDVKSVISILERLAKAQGVDIDDLLVDMKSKEHEAIRSERLKTQPALR